MKKKERREGRHEKRGERNSLKKSRRGIRDRTSRGYGFNGFTATDPRKCIINGDSMTETLFKWTYNIRYPFGRRAAARRFRVGLYFNFAYNSTSRKIAPRRGWTRGRPPRRNDINVICITYILTSSVEIKVNFTRDYIMKYRYRVFPIRRYWGRGAEGASIFKWKNTVKVYYKIA